MTRELLQQALNALDRSADMGNGALKDALREALAAPMPEPVAWAMLRADGLVLDVICPDERESYQGAYTVPLYAAPPAAPMPEPSDMVMVPREPTPEMIEAGESVEDLYRRGTPHTWKAVYRAMIAAAPPAAPAPVVREPLTQDQIISLAENYEERYHRWVFICVDELEQFARAIEQAHGIGGGGK